MIKLIIYDLDGTLIDSRRDISDAVNWTLRELGFSELPMDEVSSFVGSGVKNLMEQALVKAGAGEEKGDSPLKRGQSPVSSPVLKRSIKLFRRRYREHLLDQTCLYPSVRKVLEFFKKRRQAVSTNKPEDLTLAILKGLGVQTYFCQVRGGDQGFPKKPAPDTVMDILKKAGVTGDEAVLVGDSAIDIETGRNARVKTVAVTYGFGKPGEIRDSKPDWVLNDLEELITCPFLQNP